MARDALRARYEVRATLVASNNSSAVVLESPPSVGLRAVLTPVLIGEDGAEGKSAYQVAVDEGFVGDEAAWLASLIGPAGPGADLTASNGVIRVGDDFQLGGTIGSSRTIQMPGKLLQFIGNRPADGIVSNFRIDFGSDETETISANLQSTDGDGNVSALQLIIEASDFPTPGAPQNAGRLFFSLAGHDAAADKSLASSINVVPGTFSIGAQFTDEDDNRSAGVTVLVNKDRALVRLTGETEMLDYPSTRDDGVTPSNLLCTDIDGNVQSVPVLGLPISTDAQAALDLKADLIGGKVPSAQLPSYVDDVLEFDTLGDFPATGDAGVIYIAIDTNKNYRWTGSAYLWNNPSPGTTDALAEGVTNLYFTPARVLASVLTGLSVITNAAITAADSIVVAAGKLQAQCTAILAALTAHIGSGGTAHSNAVASGAAGFLSGTDKAKLDGVAPGATANSADAFLLDRANHSGAQAESTITGLVADLAAKVPTSTTVNGHALSGNVTVTATDVGLGHADDVSDVNKPVSTAQATADALVASNAASDATTKANAAQAAAIAAAAIDATTKANAAKAYADTLVVGLVDDRGNFDASVNAFPNSGGSGGGGAILKGDLWTISVAGTIGGHPVTAGDLVRALVDSPGTTSSNWAITENNIGYVAENASNKVTSISGASTDAQYGSAKLLYDQLALKVDSSDGRLSDARTPVGTALVSARMWVGSAGGVAAAVLMSGDITMDNSGATSINATKYPTFGKMLAVDYNLAMP